MGRIGEQAAPVTSDGGKGGAQFSVIRRNDARQNGSRSVWREAPEVWVAIKPSSPRAGCVGYARGRQMMTCTEEGCILVAALRVLFLTTLSTAQKHQVPGRRFAGPLSCSVAGRTGAKTDCASWGVDGVYWGGWEIRVVY